MDENMIERLSGLLKGTEKGTYEENILSEIYIEVKQINNKQDEILRLLNKNDR